MFEALPPLTAHQVQASAQALVVGKRVLLLLHPPDVAIVVTSDLESDAGQNGGGIWHFQAQLVRLTPAGAVPFAPPTPEDGTRLTTWVKAQVGTVGAEIERLLSSLDDDTTEDADDVALDDDVIGPAIDPSKWDA